MTKFSIVLISVLALVACNNNQTSTSIDSKADSAQVIDYAYKPQEMPNWEMGNPEHIALVLNSLKKYETGKLDELKEEFADSVSFDDDGFEFKGTEDSLIQLFKKDWETINSVSIEMHDWEAVHGKTNNENWVSLWYKATSKRKNGTIDSAFYMADVNIQNGKIRGIDIKKRRYPEKK